MKSNYSCSKDDFEDYKASDFRIKAVSPALDYGYQNIDFHKIGLIEENRKLNPPKVISYLEIDENTNKLLLSLKNQSDKNVAGKLIFFTDKYIENFSKTSIEIELAAYEMKEYEIELPRICESICEKIQIEARSNVPGIRPCKTIIG